MAHIYGGQANGLDIDSRRWRVWVISAYGRAVVVEDGTPGATPYRRTFPFNAYEVAAGPRWRRLGLPPEPRGQR